MKEKDLVSVIVPIYNMEHYLEKCITSILQQTYSSLEIILVDDGSTDKSAMICDMYAEEDKRIKVIHKKNRGVSEARNSGLEIAKGKYISFVDADDFVTKNFIEELVNAICKSKADLAICGYEKIGGIPNTKDIDVYKNQIFILDSVETVDKESVIYHTICTNIMGSYLWNKLFKAELLKNMKLDNNLLIGEDMVYVIEYEIKSKSFVYVPKPLYKYKMNPNSALNAVGMVEKRKWISCLESTEKVNYLLKEENDFIKNCSAYRQVRSSLWVMFHMVLENYYDKELSENIRTLVRRNYEEYKRIGYGSPAMRISVCVMKDSPWLLFYIGKIFFSLFPDKLYKLSRQ